MTYNLSSSQADRINFDETCRRYAIAMLEALTEEEALRQSAYAYAQFCMEHFLQDVETDDVEEAEARFLDAAMQAIGDWQRDRMMDNLNDELYNQETGYTTAIEVFPAGQKNGLDYGPVLVEIVHLCETNYGPTVAYRLSTDSMDNEWEIGMTEDAVMEALQYRAGVTAAEMYMTIEQDFYAALGDA